LFKNPTNDVTLQISHALKSTFLLLFFYLITAPNIVQSQTEHLFTLSTLSDWQLGSNQLTLKQTFENQSFTESFQLVEIGDLVSIQENGILPVQLPGDTVTYYFSANEVVSNENGDYTWIGNLISPLPCVDDSTDYIENDCIMGRLTMIKEDSSVYGDMYIENDFYHIKDIGGGLNLLIKLNLEESEDYDCGAPTSETEFEASGPEEGTHCPVRALVLFTAPALAAHPDMINIINLSIANTNFILKESHIKENLLKIVLAGTRLLDTTEFVESTNLLADLNSLPNNTAINLYREIYKADIVVIMTTAIYPGAGGGVTAFGDYLSSGDSAFAIVETPFALGPSYVFAHEVAHLFGTRHERTPQDCASTGDNSGLPYSHGKIITKKFLISTQWQKKTIMAVCSGDKSIPRMEYYSTPHIKVKNLTIGTEQSNFNAKTIAYAACRLARYVNSDEPTVYLNAPNTLCPGHSTGVEGVVSGVPGPIVYYWQTSYDGFNYTPDPPISSSSNSIGVTAPLVAGQSVWIRLTAGSSGGPLVTVTKRIMAEESYNPPCDPMFTVATKEDDKSINISLFPNPTTSGELFVQIENVEDTSFDFAIYDSFGRKIKDFKEVIHSGKIKTISVNTSDIPSGLYCLMVKSRNFTRILSFVCLH